MFGFDEDQSSERFKRAGERFAQFVGKPLLYLGAAGGGLEHPHQVGESGDPVLLYAAAGGVGSIASQWAKHLGATVIGVVSTDEIKSFKPNPAVYVHFLRQAGACGSEAWLISGNPFDVIGAISAGMRGAWVKRAPQAVFDPWEIQPTLTVASIVELCEALESGDQ